MTSAIILRPSNIVFVILLSLTLVNYTFGVLGLSDGGVALLVLLIAIVKAQLVADRFMGLRRVTGFWRPLFLAYLTLLATGIGLAFILV